MKKTILSFIFVLSINFVFAQNPVTISSTCETLEYHGTYNYGDDLNGKPRYFKTPNCSIYTNSVDCQSNFPSSYTIFWNGSSWQLEIHILGIGCQWLEEFCVQNVITGRKQPQNTIIATNTANTALPPCSGWNFTVTPACTPSFSECTTLSTNEFTFQNNFEVYPNPVTDIFNIKAINHYDQLIVTIHNALGQVVLSKQFSNTTDIEINLNQPSGIYYVKINNPENHTAYYKLVKK